MTDVPGRFFDTSAFVKRYHPEPGTAGVDALLLDPHPNLIAQLGEVELHSALAKKVRLSPPQLTPAQVATALAGFFTDVAVGRFDVRAMSPAHHAEAARLILTYGFAHPLRTLDALQLAVAAGLRSAFPTLEVVSADQTVLAVATLEGFPTVPV